jgi:hypothetical protein
MMDCLQEKSGIRLLVKAPDEQTAGRRLLACLLQIIEELGRDRCLPRAPQTDEADDAAVSALPEAMQFLKLRLPADEMRGTRKAMD